MRGLYLLSWLLALFAGLGIGLFVAWFVAPVSYSNAQAWDLSDSLKDDYLKMIASSYAVENSFALAQQRLYYLQAPDVETRLGELARQETKPLTQQALLRLLIDVQQPGVALARPTFTPRPTRNTSPNARVTVIVVVPTSPALPPRSFTTPIPTALPPTTEPDPNAPRFMLHEKRPLTCDQTGGSALIQVQVQDTSGKGLSGIGVEVNSALGNEQFFTGLKPERGTGYGDVAVLPGNYSVHLFENAQSEIVRDLRIEANVVECDSAPAAVQGWALIFKQVP